MTTTRIPQNATSTDAHGNVKQHEVVVTTTDPAPPAPPAAPLPPATQPEGMPTVEQKPPRAEV